LRLVVGEGLDSQPGEAGRRGDSILERVCLVATLHAVQSQPLHREEPGGTDSKEVGVAAFQEETEATIGMVLDRLTELGVAGNTYVIYTADHGTPGRNPPLRMGQGTVWEGGIRVPFIMRGPGIKAGVCCHTRVTNYDLVPTVCDLASVTEPLPAGIEGGSFWPLLTNGGSGTVKRPREEFVVHYPHYDKDEDGPASAILLGDLKLIRFYETGALHLFDLSKDLGEQHDLAEELPEKAAELQKRLDAYLTAVHAEMPRPNSRYGPDRAPAPESRRGGGKGGSGRGGGGRRAKQDQ